MPVIPKWQKKSLCMNLSSPTNTGKNSWVIASVTDPNNQWVIECRGAGWVDTHTQKLDCRHCNVSNGFVSVKNNRRSEITCQHRLPSLDEPPLCSVGGGSFLECLRVKWLLTFMLRSVIPPPQLPPSGIILLKAPNWQTSDWNFLLLITFISLPKPFKLLG